MIMLLINLEHNLDDLYMWRNPRPEFYLWAYLYDMYSSIWPHANVFDTWSTLSHDAYNVMF